jgi:hypothetical protein
VPVDLVAAAATPPKPPEIIGLFYVGYFHLLSGESEALKTWLALAAAEEELDAGRGALWIDGDDVGEGALLERLRSLGATDETITTLFAYMRPNDPLDQDKLPGVLSVVRDRKCRLAVFDGFNPLLGLHRLDPNSGTDVELFYRLHPEAWRRGRPDRQRRQVAGGAGRMGDRLGAEEVEVEVHLAMKTIEPLVRGGTGRAKIDVHKDRPGHLERPSPGIFVIESDDSQCSWRIDPDESRGAEGEFRPTNLMEKVSRFLERNREEPQSRNQVEGEKLGKAEYVRVAIDRLAAEGYATEFQGPRGARLLRSERPFRESAEEGL